MAELNERKEKVRGPNLDDQPSVPFADSRIGLQEQSDSVQKKELAWLRKRELEEVRAVCVASGSDGSHS